MLCFCLLLLFFFFKQKTAYEMRISDWSSYVCSSDLGGHGSTLAAQQDVLAVLAAVDRDGLQHAALLDRLAELLVVGAQVVPGVGADDDVGGNRKSVV